MGPPAAPPKYEVKRPLHGNTHCMAATAEQGPLQHLLDEANHFWAERAWQEVLGVTLATSKGRRGGLVSCI
eukprot:6939109-Pyramimonas_sp.AAC.1